MTSQSDPSRQSRPASSSTSSSVGSAHDLKSLLYSAGSSGPQGQKVQLQLRTEVSKFEIADGMSGPSGYQGKHVAYVVSVQAIVCIGVRP